MATKRIKRGLEILAKAVDEFLTDINWDETGDGSAMALFGPRQINLLRVALDHANSALAGPRCKPWCGTPCPDIGLECCWHTAAFPNRWCRKKCRDAAEKRGELPDPRPVDAELVCPTFDPQLTHHQWYKWRPYDPANPTAPAGYWRECSVMGCDAKETADRLVAAPFVGQEHAHRTLPTRGK